MINRNDLPVLEHNINSIITLISDYGCRHSPDMSRLKLIQKNIKIFQECNEGWDELIKYILEDWNTAMRSQEKIIDCYIPIKDIDLKAKYNKELEECFKRLDALFDTSWMNKRKWYSVRELIELGKSGITDPMWNSKFSFVVQGAELLKSQIVGISDVVWTYAKCLGVTSIDDELVKWFQSDIPAFGYVSLADMSKLENGEYIVRYFLTSVPLGFP
ncbi:hypothetical protein [Streptococcus suis]|jgi:hypothetical protein|uniref:Uncharacterized protein n=1 Tax=Streptococcus suis TaxID=1307 RepID=A0A9X4MLP2_STRSU|nr:hypothetical protein [Streptococcus suis]